MTQTIKISIQHKNGATFGPYHWKHILEWYEFDLMAGFSWIDIEGATRPITELVNLLSVPPTICTNAILHVQMHSGHSGKTEAMRKLRVLGFPEINGAVSNDLGAHLVKRLLMTDDELNAEDPDFDTSALATIAALLPEISNSSAQPDTMTEKPALPNTPETPNDPISEPPQPTEDISKIVIDPSINPFIEGEEVSTSESDEHYTPINRKGASKLPFIIIGLIVIGGGVGAYVFMTQQDDQAAPPTTGEITSTIEGAAPEVTKTIKPATEAIDETAKEIIETVATEATEIVDAVVTDAIEATEKLASSAEETVESMTSDLTDKVTEAGEMNNSAETVNELIEGAAEDAKAITDATKIEIEESTETTSEETAPTETTTDEVASDANEAISEKTEEFAVSITEEVSEKTTAETIEVIETETTIEEPLEVVTPQSSITIDSSGKTTLVESSGASSTDEQTPAKEDNPIKKFPDYVPTF